MRIAIATVQVPFVRGGAEALAGSLARAASRCGHEVEVVSAPFCFAPPTEVERCIRFWRGLEVASPDSRGVDAVVCLQFPTYYLDHPDKRVWLLHQHRSAYELEPRLLRPEEPIDADEILLRRRIRRADDRALASCGLVRTIAKTVSARLLHFNNVFSTPLYHPPPLADRHYAEKAEPFVLFPSRLVWHKRQDLFIEAMRQVGDGVTGVLAGDGPLRSDLERRIEEAGLGGRVHLLGRVSESELLALYARCSAVFFGPFDEDYGYVTLEAMLSAKPVITCNDSGGPLEFVAEGETGLVCEPEPAAIATAIDRLVADPAGAAAMGERGRQRYDELVPSWESVVGELLA